MDHSQGLSEHPSLARLEYYILPLQDYNLVDFKQNWEDHIHVLLDLNRVPREEPSQTPLEELPSWVTLFSSLLWGHSDLANCLMQMHHPM